MDFLSDDLPEDVADSKWLSEETNALVSKIGTALSSGAPVDAVAASSSGQLTNDANATPGQSDALLPKFGAHVRGMTQLLPFSLFSVFNLIFPLSLLWNIVVRFKGHEHAFVLGRTNPMTLPIPLFEGALTLFVSCSPMRSCSPRIPRKCTNHIDTLFSVHSDQNNEGWRP